MFPYFVFGVICSSKLLVFFELCSWKTVYFLEQIMSADNVHFLCQVVAIVYVSLRCHIHVPGIWLRSLLYLSKSKVVFKLKKIVKILYFCPIGWYNTLLMKRWTQTYQLRIQYDLKELPITWHVPSEVFQASVM